MFSARTDHPDQTRLLAAALAAVVDDGDVIVLTGELGAGKTVFAKGLAAGLGYEGTVTSPTFTLVKSYEGGRLVLHHADAYRLADPTETPDLALPELVEDSGVVVVEWGELVTADLPPDRLVVQLGRGRTDDERMVVVTLHGPAWMRRNPAVRQALAPWTGPGSEGA